MEKIVAEIVQKMKNLGFDTDVMVEKDKTEILSALPFDAAAKLQVYAQEVETVIKAYSPEQVSGKWGVKNERYIITVKE